MFIRGNLFPSDFERILRGNKQDRSLERGHNNYFKFYIKNGALLRSHKIPIYNRIFDSGTGNAVNYGHPLDQMLFIISFSEPNHLKGKVL